MIGRLIDWLNSQNRTERLEPGSLVPASTLAPLAPPQIRAEQFADGQEEVQQQRVEAIKALHKRVMAVANGRDDREFTADELALMAEDDVGVRLIDRPSPKDLVIEPSAPWQDSGYRPGLFLAHSADVDSSGLPAYSSTPVQLVPVPGTPFFRLAEAEAFGRVDTRVNSPI